MYRKIQWGFGELATASKDADNSRNVRLNFISTCHRPSGLYVADENDDNRGDIVDDTEYHCLYLLCIIFIYIGCPEILPTHKKPF